MKVHELKTWPRWFKRLWSGEKRFEVRKNDRRFHVGDTLFLREYIKHPITSHYTGRRMRFVVRHVWKDLPGITDGYVILDLACPIQIDKWGNRVGL